MNLFNSSIICSCIKEETNFILKIESKDSNINGIEWIKENKSILEECIIKFKGILLRNFQINSVSSFNKVTQIFCSELLDYVYRSTPRTKLGGKIYTATEYPARRIIPLHNEFSYAKLWPEKILFYSVIAAQEGGETSISDSAAVYRRIDPSIRKKFKTKQVLYVRNYSHGIDLPWQEVFQTNDKKEVESYCKNHDIECTWKSKPELTTKNVAQATTIHLTTNTPVWFNQAHLFHISSIPEKDKKYLIKELGEENVPRNAFYGDGEAIELEVLDHIRQAYEKEKAKFLWKNGDIMILDNVLTAHGRERYKGERKVVVAMGS